MLMLVPQWHYHDIKIFVFAEMSEMLRIFGKESMFKDNLCVGHTAWAMEGHEAQGLVGPKDSKPAQRAFC